MPPAPPAPTAPVSLWSLGYAYFLVNFCASTLAVQVLNAVVGYQIYQLTGDPLALGLVGLAEAVPFLLLVLFGGHLADRIDRRWLSLVAFATLLAAAVALWALTRSPALGKPAALRAVFALIVVIGICRSFIQPARAALRAQLAPRVHAARAIAWSTGVFQISAVAGPAIGGVLIAGFGPDGGYAAAAGLLALAMGALLCLRLPARAPVTARPPLFASLAEGIRYLRRDRVLSAAILLDLLAVLFGGAVALLPAFADDVLGVGPRGFGLLRAAPAAGALVASAILALAPPLRRAGLALYLAVAGFGLCMIGFALSRWFPLSLALLALSGAFDMVSILVRTTLLQLRVPDEMMGRISAINQVFVGSSNEIGAFESGLAARLLGLVPSVVVGGTITLAVVAASAYRSPELRRLDSLT